MTYINIGKTNPCGVVAIDIAGNEAERVALNKSFTKTFKAAKDSGFFVTIHAGTYQYIMYYYYTEWMSFKYIFKYICR